MNLGFTLEYLQMKISQITSVYLGKIKLPTAAGAFFRPKRKIFWLLNDRSLIQTMDTMSNSNPEIKVYFFSSYYRPNTSDMVSLDELNNSLFKVSDKLNDISAGDFNAPIICGKGCCLF